MLSDKIILGVDPGTIAMGYGLIHSKNKNLKMINYGVLNLSKLESQQNRLKQIFDRISDLIYEYKPDVISVEAPFFGKNVQSMLKLGRAQGVVMAAALNKNIPVFEYSPRKIKKSITGNGNSSKEQVASMIKNLISIKELPKNLDATDGLAAAICHYFQRGENTSQSNYSNWKSFIKHNKSKIKSSS